MWYASVVGEESTYVHGNSPEEQQRLSLLNDILNDSCIAELGPRPGERVLDVGSGLGQFTSLIARNVGPDGHVIGVERDGRQLSEATKLARAESHPMSIEFRQGDATELPLRESEWGTFDLAHARFLLEHVPDPTAVVAQMVRSVRPGGRVFVADDDHGNYRPWPEPAGFRALWDAYVHTYERAGNDPYVGRRLVTLLAEQGLAPIRNSCVFFGGCAGDDRFDATVENLIATFLGAKKAMLVDDVIDESSFDYGLEGLRAWRVDPSAALWYVVCCAEGVVPAREPGRPKQPH